MIVAASDEDMICRCPSRGCGLKARFKFGDNIPSCDPALNRDTSSIPIGSFSDLRKVLRSRREELRLSINDTEEIAGLSVDHIAKMEKDRPDRIPNLDTIIHWANALGLEITLRPTEMTPFALRRLQETRHLAERRGRRISQLRRRGPSSSGRGGQHREE